MYNIKMGSHKMVLSVKEWNKLKNLGGIRASEDTTKKKYIAELDRASEEMRKNWDQDRLTIEETNDRRRRKEEYEELMKFYKELMEIQQKQRDNVLADARDTFFKQIDEPRKLESAFMCAEMLKEQEAQREFNKKIKKEAKNKDLEYFKFLTEKFEEWQLDQNRIMKKRTEKDIEASLVYKKEIEENKKQKLKAKEEKLEMEKRERETTIKELQEIEKAAIEKKKKEQEAFKNYIEQMLVYLKARREDEQCMMVKEEKVNEIYQNVQAQIRDMCEKRRREIIIKNTKTRDSVRATFPDKTIERQKKEEEIYEKVSNELCQKQFKMEEDRKAYMEALREKRLKTHEEWLERKEQILENKRKLELEQLNNRLENFRETRALNERLKHEKLMKVAKLKSTNIKQLKEAIEKKARDKAEKNKFYGDDRIEDYEAADMKFFAYANKLLDECQKTGRPTQPILKVINDYKSRYLHPHKPLPLQLKTHFPALFAEINDKNNE